MELKRYTCSEAYEKFPLDKEVCLGCEVWEVERELREERAQREMAEAELALLREASATCQAYAVQREAALREQIVARNEAERELAEVRGRLARLEHLLREALDTAAKIIGPGCEDGPQGWRTLAYDELRRDA